ncbi:TIGR02453 family protein [Flavobacteriaceae bacterium AU392]|nr:DUF2461 domain-containing protein [Flavobacteriaceae bacterium]RKM85557.1 TIGR02453 family protein [Flavobacteriaceae bacterium AU392]
MSIKVPKAALDFFKQLEINNNREWFTEHKVEFKTVETEVKQCYAAINNVLNTHDEIEKFKLFRIYRDVRFSKDKTPYKTHFGGSYGRKKPELRGGYYLHIAPNDKSFIATGFWEPSKEDLYRIRKELEMDDEELRGIINKSSFKNIWGDLVGDELKTAPRDFNKEHKAIDLIKKKQFIFTKKYTDKEVLGDNFLDEVNIAFKAIRPYFDYMSDVLTTDLNGESLL